MKRIGVAILRFLRRRRVDRDDGCHYVGSDQDIVALDATEALRSSPLRGAFSCLRLEKTPARNEV